MYEHNKNIVEGAGGACLIGAYELRKQLKGKRSSFKLAAQMKPQRC